MKKIRFLALFLAVALLLGVFPATARAAASEVPKIKVSLTLTDSFAINYKISADAFAPADFDRVEFWHEDVLLQTVTSCPDADSNGMYAFSYTNIAPHKMNYTVTAKLYAGDVEAKQTASVAAYCKAVLANSGVYGEKLAVLVMELLDYGAAAQKYQAYTQDTTVEDTDLVNDGIAAAYPDIAALCPTDTLTYSSVQHIGKEISDAVAKWTGAGLVLHETISIRYRFELNAPNQWSLVEDIGATIPTGWSLNSGTGTVGESTAMGNGDSSSIQIDSGCRAKYAKSGLSLQTGWYRLSGYVYLESPADAAKISITNWEKNAGSGNNTPKHYLNECIVGEALEGWNYFEFCFQHLNNQSTLQFIVNNNEGYGKTLYFDDLKYDQYIGEGTPGEEVDLKDLAEGLYLVAECGGKTWTVKDICDAGKENTYYAYFTGLNPSQMRDTVVVTVRNSAGETVSESLAYSIESYVSAINAKNVADELKELVQEMLRYGDATKQWAQKWTELTALDLENETIADVPMSQTGSYALGELAAPGYGSAQAVQLNYNERAIYSKTMTMAPGKYRISGYVYLNGASATNVSLTIWVRGETSNFPTTFSMADYIVGETSVDGWSYFEIEFEHLTTMSSHSFTVNNYHNFGDSSVAVSFDNLKYEKFVDADGAPEIEPEEPAEPELEKAWKSIVSFDFEDGISLVQNTGTVSVTNDATRTGSTKVLEVDNSSRAEYSSTDVSVPVGNYLLCGYVKLVNNTTGMTVDPSNSAASISIWAYSNSVNGGNLITPRIADSIVGDAVENGWYYFEMPFDYGTEVNQIKFILNNYDSANTAYFDDVQYMREVPVSEQLADQWAEKLETEELEGSMLVHNSLTDPFVERPALGSNLISSGTFYTLWETVLMDNGTYKKDFGSWNTIKSSSTGVTSKVTSDGIFRADASSTNTGRTAAGIYQSINVEPGAVYQIKFRYRIDPTNATTSSWYGPYVKITSTTGDDITLRAFAAPGGLDTSGEWAWFTQSFSVTDQSTSVLVNLCSWLYPGDWCEMDDVQVYKVYEPQISLDVLTKFYYADMESATFTANVSDGSNVRFEVFDGLNSLWSMDAAVSDGKANAVFDLSKMTVAKPHIVKATLLDSNGNELDATSERIFVYDRPATLDKDGNFIKQTPNGEKLDYNAAYAILPQHYDKVKDIGCNVMSLSNIRSAEQIIGLLDQCEEKGYMGFLNMNWGLYNETDITQKRAILIDVVSSEEVRNHPALLGYCLADEPWSWGCETFVAANLEEGYRLIREYDTENIIFSVNNMSQFHEHTTKYSDVLFVDHYEAPASGTIYDKVSIATNAAAGRMPVWTILGAYKTGNGYFPTGDEVRNEIWQAFLAGAEGVGYYCISLADYVDGVGVPIWDVTDSSGDNIGEDLWNGLKSFKEKEWDIAYDHFADGEGKVFNKKLTSENGYMYYSWVDEHGDLYLIVLNLAGKDTSVAVQVPLVSDDDKLSVGKFTATVISGSDQTSITGDGTFTATLAGNQAVLYKIAPECHAEFDFEDGVSLTQMQGTVTVTDDSTRPNSTKVLKLGVNSRAEYTKTGLTIPAGTYRLSGYVKLTEETDISVTIWSYLNTVNNTNTVTLPISNWTLGEEDADGWRYFEVIFEHTVQYSTAKFILNNYNTKNELYFDDIVYGLYLGLAELTQE